MDGLNELSEIKCYLLNLAEEEEHATKFKFEIIYSTISTKNKELHTKFLQKDAYFKLRASSVQLFGDKKYWLCYRDISRNSFKNHEYSNCLIISLNNILIVVEADFVTVPLLIPKQEDNILHLSRANQNEVSITLFLISSKKTIQNSLKYLKPSVTTYYKLICEIVLVY